VIRLAVNGAAGRMGAQTCTLARDDHRFELVARIDSKRNAVSDECDAQIDAVIDFSTDDGTRGAATFAMQHDAALMIGTTGLSRQTLSAIEVASRTIPVMIAPNTSAGVAVMIHLVSEAARLLGRDHDVDLVEVHHSGKRDAPSGTALRIAEAMRERAGFELPPDRIHAIRAGEVIGEHTVEFFSAGERIRVAHVATSRDLFARGALDAVAWLHDRGPGRWTIEQSLGLESTP
jgi:4-hydroxy-tetrahydrodipicolinate reductase